MSDSRFVIYSPRGGGVGEIQTQLREEKLKGREAAGNREREIERAKTGRREEAH